MSAVRRLVDRRYKDYAALSSILPINLVARKATQRDRRQRRRSVVAKL